MPQGGMPAQGPKGAQNQKNEFKQKGGGAPAAASGPAAQPKVAGTPAGAAGHKNQDPKGKQVKPTKPPRSAPPKPAKGKGPGQTGPNPKNKSKPSEQKLDAKPIVERFSMHGESHQLIMQLGPGGHVDMASKRERLSVKVGNAVSKLSAKQAPPQQIAELKAIGATAKRGDKLIATAKLTDKPGTSQVAQQTLTLPPVSSAPLRAAGSLQEIASQVAQQTGVPRVVLEKHGEFDAGLVGEINPRYTFVEITDANVSPMGEFDTVIHDGTLTDRFIEDKNASGLAHPMNKQTPADWARKQIYDKTAVRLTNLASASGSRPRPDGAGSPTVPTLAELQSIKALVFEVEATDAVIQTAVSAEVANLAAAFPAYKFSATFGP
jgi:hypothetical protein